MIYRSSRWRTLPHKLLLFDLQDLGLRIFNFFCRWLLLMEPSSVAVDIESWDRFVEESSETVAHLFYVFLDTAFKIAHVDWLIYEFERVWDQLLESCNEGLDSRDSFFSIAGHLSGPFDNVLPWVTLGEVATTVTLRWVFWAPKGGNLACAFCLLSTTSFRGFSMSRFALT